MGTTSQKLTYLNTTKQLLKTEINKINNVLDDNSTFRSYPEELFNGYLDILNNGTDTLWNNLEKVSASGEEATLENVETAPIKMVLNGNTSQDTTTGKNLLKLGTGETHLGITSVINANGSISYSGTAESSYCKLGTEVNVNIPAGTYAFSRNERLNYGTRILITFEDNTTTNPTIASGNLAATFTTTQTIKKIQVYLITLTANTTYNGTQYLQLESGSTATSWEKYTGGQPSPSPDFPQEVKVVKGENVVSVQGKQLLDTSIYSLGSINGNTGQNEESSSVYRFDKYNEVNPNTTIYLLKHLCIYFYNENKGFISSNITGNLTITTPPNTKYIRFRIFGADFSTFNPNDYMVSYTQETHFVPYSKTDYFISLGTIEMCKIGNYKDFPFKAINGNEYYDSLTDEQKNALNYGSWYVHKEIGKTIFDGSESWSRTGTQYSTEYYRFRHGGLENIILKPLGNSELMLGYCNLFVVETADNTYKRYNGISCTKTGYIDIYYEPLKENTNNEFITWLSTHNVTLYYALATPTEEEITNTTLIEQLEAIYKAKSVKDKTCVTQTNDELPFILDVQAIKEYEVV